ncbi:MAG: glycosyltransferase [Candidatus Krumholzibacteriota bacterium]|nr:glycosyltransferase [Candidatus Krumholzibacteriota bacterium]
MNSTGKDKNLIIVCSTLVTGGAEVIVKALCELLPRHRLEPVLVCLREPGEVGEAIASSGIRTFSRLAGARYDPLAVFRLAGVLKRYPGAGIIVLDHHDAIFLTAIATKFIDGRRKVLSVHSTGLWKTGKIFNWTDRLVLGSYDKVIALADNHRDFLSENEGVSDDRLVIINNGVDIARFHPVETREKKGAKKLLGLSDEDFVVTIIAALRPEKNHMMFIEAALKIAESEGGRFRFLIVGEGPMETGLKKAADRLLSQGTLKFLGRREDTESILAATDVAILSSFPVVETFPLTILEAMATGLPVISTAVGSIPEMLEDGREGILIESGDVGALAENMIRLSKERTFREEIGRKARDRVIRDFSVDRMIEGYAGLFD